MRLKPFQENKIHTLKTYNIGLSISNLEQTDMPFIVPENQSQSMDLGRFS